MGKYSSAVERVSKGTYYKFQDGDNRLRFLCDPVVQNKTFPDKPDESQTIFSWYIWDYRTDSVAILSKGPGFIRNVDAIMEEWGEELPLNCDLNIKKSGSGFATKYNWVPSPVKEELPDDWKSGLKPLTEVLDNAIDITKFGNGSTPTISGGSAAEIVDYDDPFAGIPTV